MDFYSPQKKLIIELDGSQHVAPPALSGTLPKYDGKIMVDDEICVSYLGREGMGWNNDVLKDMESILKVIWSELDRDKEK